MALLKSKDWPERWGEEYTREVPLALRVSSCRKVLRVQSYVYLIAFVIILTNFGFVIEPEAIVTSFASV